MLRTEFQMLFQRGIVITIAIRAANFRIVYISFVSYASIV